MESLGRIHPCWHPALRFLCPKCLPWAKARWLGDDVGLQGGRSLFELVLHRVEKATAGSAPALGTCRSSCPADLKNLSPSLPEAGEMWCWTSLGLACVMGLGRGHPPDIETVIFVLSVSSVLLFPFPAPVQDLSRYSNAEHGDHTTSSVMPGRARATQTTESWRISQTAESGPTCQRVLAALAWVGPFSHPTQQGRVNEPHF